jgi:hypothetical protein
MPTELESVSSYDSSPAVSYSVGTSPVLIAALNKNRVQIIVANTHATIPVALLFHETDDYSTGALRLQPETVAIDSGEGLYRGKIWAVAASGTVTVNVQELERATL